MTENPNYYAIIPAEVRYDKELTPNAKLLYAEITALTNMNGKCFADNNYFAKLYGVSKVSISKWINQLIKKGYLFSEIIYKEGSKEIDKRYLTFVKHPIKEKFNTPIKEKLKDNNNNITYSNNNLIDNNIKNEVIKSNPNTVIASLAIKESIIKWLEYKKERKQKYTTTGLKECISKLEKLSNNNPEIAMEIVNESIANNWSGLFALKPKKEEKIIW